MTRPEVAADAVLLVDDRVADANLGEVAQHRVDVRAPRGIALVPAHDAGIELRFGDERELRLGPGEARVQRRDDQRAAQARRAAIGAPVVGERHAQAVLGEVLLHRLAPARALGADQHARVGGREVALQRRQRIRRAPVDLHSRKRLRRGSQVAGDSGSSPRRGSRRARAP